MPASYLKTKAIPNLSIETLVHRLCQNPAGDVERLMELPHGSTEIPCHERGQPLVELALRTLYTRISGADLSARRLNLGLRGVAGDYSYIGIRPAAEQIID